MFYHMNRIWLLLLLGGFLVPGVRHVCGIEIYTPSEVEAVNGTSVKLKCTFSSSHPVSRQSVMVSWNFRPLKGGKDESVFHYQDIAYPPQNGPFKDHAVWSGDIMRKDASITLLEVPPTFNGTYICQVRNLPDVHGQSGEIILKVVSKASVSELSILVTAVAGACGVILILLGIFVAVRFFKKKRMENDIELDTGDHSKDKTVCSPAEAAYVMYVTKKIEAVSSDDEESEPSSGDDDNEEDCLSGDDDDDDDDDDIDDDDDDD